MFKDLKVGDYVTRNSYDNDILFIIVAIEDDVAYLKGIDVRLYADSNLDDLELASVKGDSNSDRDDVKNIKNMFNLDRSEYFYLPGKILHIDGDKDYLERCIDFYKDMHLEAYGVNLSEDNFERDITSCLEEYKPDILVITGHDSFKKNKNKNKLSSYQNSNNFVKATIKAREFERNQDKLIIISGACQSFYEDLIKAASAVALSPKNKEIDLLSLLSKTHYGSDGMGGIITNGVMYVGYPR